MKPITRTEAKARGLDRFYTGEPCEHGHIAERYVAKPCKCVECQRLKNQRERSLRQQYDARTPARGTRLRDRTRVRNAERLAHVPPPFERDHPRPDNGLCQACGAPGPLWMDHDHITGAFRAWVCPKCNMAPERVLRRPEDKLAAEIASEVRRLKLS